MKTDLRSIHWDEVRGHVTSNREKVYLALLNHGPCTAKELAHRIGWDKTSVRPRLTELQELFHARPTGKRRNDEHEFEALSHAEAHLLWQAAQPKPSNANQPELCLA